MLQLLKKRLYFFVAGYFRFWASFVLKRWQPRVILATGSNGKTTALHLIEAQLTDKAVFSHRANSSFGVPFHLLGLERKTLNKIEWLLLIILAPFRAFRRPPKPKIFVVEADCDRPREGKFLAEFLKPEVTLWISSSRTHSANFDHLVDSHKFLNVEEAIAYEFGHFIEYAQKLVLINADVNHMAVQEKRATASVKELHKGELLEDYQITKDTTTFKTKRGNIYKVGALLPENAFYAVAMTHMLVKYLGYGFDPNFTGFVQPPGRDTVFSAKNGALLFDSTYNANLDNVAAAMGVFALYPAKTRWGVISDMVEQGQGEKTEHQLLAELLAEQKFDRIILMGPRVMRYTKPRLKKLINDKTVLVAFEKPKPVLDYLNQELTGKEIVFFKGSRFLEGVIKNLLKDPKDADRLCRREAVWQKRREKWGVG